MSIPIEKEEFPEQPFERCCFCRRPTPWWTNLSDREPGQQVACCPQCAKTRRQPESVPEKREWVESERQFRVAMEDVLG